MNELQFLAQYPSLIGENSFWMFFSAKKIAEHFEISLYAARKLIKSLVNAGIVKRYGNQYMLDNDGCNIAYTLMSAKNRKEVKAQ